MTGEGKPQKENADYSLLRDVSLLNGEEFVSIPRVSGRISAGGGLIPDNAIEMRIAFRRDWIQRKGSSQNMSLIRVAGDSMEPTLQSGDVVLIDHGRNYVDPHGGIYAIVMDDEIVLKRLQIIYPTRKIKVISDNLRYEPSEIEPDQIKINGKVIWCGREIER
jgi:phage repressor protein C with HTH and peptisase S24 domain